MKKKKKNVFLYVLLVIILNAQTIAADNYNCDEGRHKDIEIFHRAATEEDDGEIRYQCDICSRIYSETLFSVVHQWNDWVVRAEPTCTHTGLRSRTCIMERDHIEEEEIPALGHKYEETVIPPTCINLGLHRYTCTVCSESYEEPFGELQTHHLIPGERKKPTCVQEGEELSYCSGCDYTEVHSIEKIEHAYGEWNIDHNQICYRECQYGCGERQEQAMLPTLQMEEPREEKGSVLHTIINVALTAAFSVWIIPDILLLSWVKNKRKEIRKRRKIKQQEEDGFRYE